MDYIHEPVMVHYVLDSLQQLPIPHVLVVRLVPESVNHCGGKVGTHKTLVTSSQTADGKKKRLAKVTQAVEKVNILNRMY